MRIEFAKNSCDHFVISQSTSFSLIHCCLSDLGVTLVEGGLEPCTLLPSSAVISGPLSVKKEACIISVFLIPNIDW